MTDSERKEQLRLAQAGDAGAFGALYEEVSLDLYRFAYWYLQKKEDAEDAVQEACVAAFKGIRALKKPEAFKSWFMKILLNRCKDMVRARERFVTVGQDDPSLETLSYTQDFSQVGAEELLYRLDPTDREIVLLSVYAGFKSGEIGQCLGMKAGSVRSRLSRAMQTLRKELEEAKV